MTLDLIQLNQFVLQRQMLSYLQEKENNEDDDYRYSQYPNQHINTHPGIGGSQEEICHCHHFTRLSADKIT
jgi:hypothetical protein